MEEIKEVAVFISEYSDTSKRQRIIDLMDYVDLGWNGYEELQNTINSHFMGYDGDIYVEGLDLACNSLSEIKNLYRVLTEGIENEWPRDVLAYVWDNEEELDYDNIDVDYHDMGGPKTDIEFHEWLGMEFIADYGEIPGWLEQYIDYESYGRDLAINENWNNYGGFAIKI